MEEARNHLEHHKNFQRNVGGQNFCPAVSMGLWEQACQLVLTSFAYFGHKSILSVLLHKMALI